MSQIAETEAHISAFRSLFSKPGSWNSQSVFSGVLSEPKIEFTRSGEQWIAYSTYGSGPLDVVFVSPIMSNVEVMTEPPQLSQTWAQLANLGRLILFDRRGAGWSDPAPRGSDESALDAWSDDLQSVLDAVEADKVCLFTFDTGAQYTLTFAAAHPERVRSVALIEPQVPGAGMAGGPELADLMATMADTYWGSGVINRAFSPVVAQDPDSAAWWARFERASMSRGTARDAFRDFLLLDVASVVSVVQAPVLIMYSSGRLGPMVQPPGPITASSALWLSAHLEHASLIEVDHSDLQWWWQPHLRAQMLDAVSTHFSGAPSAPNLDRVLATVVFTDIVGSTERAASLGDTRWLEVLEGHDDLAARELQRHRGEKIKSTGDGLLAIFDGPSRAVSFAQAMCAASRSLGLELRAGVHTGEIERLGDDIGGIAVHIGQRVSAHAGPSQVLVSRTVVDLVVGSDLHFTDLGDFNLKGVPGEWPLYSLIG